ncbi:protein kinase [Rothia sp. P3C3.S176]|uniref:serine/threonine protein kinase n=1 Tax=Rothia sp. P3C3.S176 TaxID=2962204 RepID=UPI0020C8642F|nr:serine/threonine protein kinase [Rothia sp. P3C3.S176]
MNPRSSANTPVPPATRPAAPDTAIGSSQWLSGAIIEGHYQVGSLIGRGGMSEVYYALDLWSNNPVALKVLSPALAEDAANRQKFHREERSMRQVGGGGHTVGVISSGTEYFSGQIVMYIVLEYVHGCTLSQLLRVRNALSLGEALDILIPVVEALSEVHANRYLHGDIKPGNILLDANGQVKLTDFGLSRRDDQVDAGAPMGTPAYVAPEVLDPKVKVGAQADIFALGVMMYRMLSGRLPFVALENDQQVLYHNANIEMPALTDVAPGADRDIAGLISWCTRKQPHARPEDATELFTALLEISESLGEHERAWRAPSCPEPELPLWEAIADIAERSGAAQMVRNTPISAFSDARDLLVYDVYSPDSLVYDASATGQGVHLADVDAEDSVLNRQGIPPLVSSAPYDEDSEGEPEKGKKSAKRDLGSFLDRRAGAKGPQTQSVGIGPQTEQEFISANGEYAPIQAERSLSPAGSHRSKAKGAASASEAEEPTGTSDDSAQSSKKDPRMPTKQFRTPPSGMAVGGWALALILMGMGASFTGWWLATSLVQSEWWRNFEAFLTF